MIQEITCKTAIHYHDTTYASNWDLNIYRGCHHRCRYCFAQYSHKYLQNDGGRDRFFGDIFVKTNVAEVLDRELSRKSWNNKNIINISGVSDCYQPIEKKYGLMREVLGVMIKHRQSINILTKSTLIMRDYDLLEELSGVAKISIGMSINCLDPKINKLLEPSTPSGLERLEALGKIAKLPCRTCIMIMPVIPYLTDRPENLEAIFSKAKELGIGHIICGSLNMRGSVKRDFYSFLRQNFPETYGRIQKLYVGAYVSKMYSERLRNYVRGLRKKYGFSKYEYKKEEDSPQLDLFG